MKHLRGRLKKILTQCEFNQQALVILVPCFVHSDLPPTQKPFESVLMSQERGWFRMSRLYEYFSGKDYDFQDSWLGGVVFL